MRTPPEPRNARPSLPRLLDAAVERGVVSDAQRQALAALAGELGIAVEPAPAGPTGDAERPEASRGFNGVMVAYGLGVMLVLFALGWFLVDRWRDLGGGGVLAVSLVYVALFVGAGVGLRKGGYATAGGLAITLAVGMTPVWTWALLRLAGEWPPATDPNDPRLRYTPWLLSRWMILELATIVVALAVVRRVRFFALGAPIAAALLALLLHAGEALADPALVWYLGPFYQAVVACALLALAYGVERRQPRDEDYARWFYAAGAGLLLIAYLQLWNRIGVWRHALPLVALALATAALYLRRRLLLIAAGLALFGYLAYLAFDVFEGTVALPIVLAAFGLVVIVATVWAQRRFPALSARLQGAAGGSARPSVPGGMTAMLAPLAIALVAFGFAWRVAPEESRERRRVEAEAARRRPAPVRPESTR